jgi:hypothetical protein
VTATAAQTAKFAKIFDMERSTQQLHSVRGFTSGSAHQREQSARGLAADKRRLFEAIDALSPEEMRLYGEYRAATFAEWDRLYAQETAAAQ